MNKQRVLIVNKFYYPRGGDCVCTLNLERLLSTEGHNTAVFAMQYPDNIDSTWSRYFAPEVKFGGGPSSLIKALSRTMGRGDIKASFQNILNDFKPDVVHLNNIHSYLSPILAKLAKQHGARVVWTLHDYKLLCPSYSCLNNGATCEKCFSSKITVITNRCMKGSLAASGIAWLEAVKWNRKRLEKYVDAFICPSEFMRSKMIQGKFNPDKLTTLCNFVDPVKLDRLSQASSIERKPGHYCYIGRLSPEKGVGTLLEAASRLPHQLIIAGGGPLAATLKEQYAGYKNIMFTGHLDASAVSDLLKSSHCSVIPSECYENNPLGAIESLCAGTPVIGADIGGIPELITSTSGITFKSADADNLTNAIDACMRTTFDNESISRDSIKRFSPMNHYSKLMDIYNNM